MQKRKRAKKRAQKATGQKKRRVKPKLSPPKNVVLEQETEGLENGKATRRGFSNGVVRRLVISKKKRKTEGKQGSLF